MNAKKIMSLALAASMLMTGAVGCKDASKPEENPSSQAIEQVEESEAMPEESVVEQPEEQPEESVVEQPEEQSEEQPEEQSEEQAAEGEMDFSNPSIVIELGDIEGIKDFASKMQNFEIEEGTIIKITGIWNKPGMSASVAQEDEASGDKWGVQMFFDYEQEDLADGTKIEVVGHAVKGQYFMEFHVAEGCMTLVEEQQ